MSSQRTKRRAYSPEQWNSVKKSDGTAERTKVFGVLEEGSDGSIYLSKFESTPAPASAPPAEAPVEKATAAEPETVEDGVSWYCPIVKADDDQRLVTGIVLEPETVDAQGDIYDDEVIRKAAHDFLRQYNAGNVIGFMHKDMNRPLDLVESWLAPANMKLAGKSIKKGTWMMTVQVHDDSIWKSVKDGKIGGFSIGGIAKVERLVVDEAE